MTQWIEFLDPDGPDGAYLPWKRVEPRVGISRTTAWRLQRAGEFPRPYVVSPGRVAYKESEVEAWKASRGHRGECPARGPSTSAPAISVSMACDGAEAPRAPRGARSQDRPSAVPAPEIPAERRERVGSANRKRGDTRQITFDF